MTTRQFLYSLLLVFLIGGFTSCNKDDDETLIIEPEEDQVLMSYEFGAAISSITIKYALSSMSTVYPEAGELFDEVISGVSVYKVTYETTFQGESLVASGLVAIPTKEGNYPILSFQNGTNVLYSEAPTKDFEFDPDDPYKSMVVLESMASLGYVIVVSDYPGFGSSESVFHPYLEKDNTVPAMVDLILAAKEMLKKEEFTVKPTDDLYIAGYSQGGWSSMCLLDQLEHSPVDGIQLVAASCGAGPYNISEMNDYVLGLENYPMPYYFGYMLQAYSLHGLVTNPLSDVFADEYASKIPDLFDFETSGGMLNVALTQDVHSLFQAEYISDYATAAKFAGIRSAFEHNSITAWNMSTPTKLFHGAADAYVPLQISESFVADSRALGVSESKLELITIEGADHTGGVLPFGLQTMKWFLSLN